MGRQARIKSVWKFTLLASRLICSIAERGTPMAIRVYNTLSHDKEDFQPVVPGRVGIYLCGPTVYKPSHIGHAVGPIIFDAIKRYLQFRGYDVTWVVNVTDVDDKIIVEAANQGRTMLEIAREIEANYKECLAELGVRTIDHWPRATECIGDIVALVQRLVNRGAAYVTDGDVYFDHTQAADYGKLSGRRVEESLAGTREIAGQEARRHPADFALWKASKPGEPAWDSPWGPGRPGWHIECSAMSIKLLGETFDIHGGGMDLIFPHHENEIAQSETATGKCFAKYWMHNGLTRIKTKLAGGEAKAEKMSKSLGNIRTISSLLEQYSGETIRYFVLSTHYRRPLDFSDEQLEASGRALENFYRVFDDLARLAGSDVYAAPVMQTEPGKDLQPVLVGMPPGLGGQLEQAGASEADVHFVGEIKSLLGRFFDAMADDFNTAGAIAALHEMNTLIARFLGDHEAELAVGDERAGLLRELAGGAGQALVTAGRILGLFEQPPKRQAAGPSDAEIQALIDERAAAKKARNFARADEIRSSLAAQGITLEDTPRGTIFRRA